MRPIDLRSDTVTRPTPGMLEAMVDAEVGDDVLGDDPTVIKLQHRIAEIMGKPAACFVPTGTMANQAAIRAHTEPGDEVIAHAESHIIHYETGAPAALSGVMVRPLAGERGIFTGEQVEHAVRHESIHAPRSRLLVVENTHNRGGGAVWPIEQIRNVTAVAKHHGLRRHLDGARVWNACAASGLKPVDYAQHFDTVSCCFSKALGAPCGSAVAGDADTIRRVHRFRKMFGGAMRQSGILAAAALYALDHHRDGLHQDHANAKTLASAIANTPGLALDPAQQTHGVETNIVFFDLAPDLTFDAAELCKRLRASGILMMPTGPRRVRAVTHLDATADMIAQAVAALERIVAAKAVA